MGWDRRLLGGSKLEFIYSHRYQCKEVLYIDLRCLHVDA
jgi:hypothetical protein